MNEEMGVKNYGKIVVADDVTLSVEAMIPLYVVSHSFLISLFTLLACVVSGDDVYGYDDEILFACECVVDVCVFATTKKPGFKNEGKQHNTPRVRVSASVFSGTFHSSPFTDNQAPSDEKDSFLHGFLHSIFFRCLVFHQTV